VLAGAAVPAGVIVQMGLGKLRPGVGAGRPPAAARGPALLQDPDAAAGPPMEAPTAEAVAARIAAVSARRR
jgi:hypothetical protein